MNNDDIAFAPIHQLAALVATRKLDPVALVELYLDRIARFDGALHSYVEVMREEALRRAKACATALKDGLPLGRLHGVPIAVKDLCDIEGRVSGAGSRRRCGIRAAVTAPVIQRLIAAGAVLLGKTHMVEFAFGAWGTNAVLGTPRNPWDDRSHRVPGGSSSGSGVAVAAGLAGAAIGSDTGGSVRIPASLCGIVGLKTTHGRITTEGVVPLSRSLDTIGPMTRCVRDAALLFEVLADDYAAGRPNPSDGGLERGVAGLRLGVPYMTQLDEIDGSVAATFQAACESLRSLGARVDEVEFPLAYFGSAPEMQIIISAEGYAANSSFVDSSGPALDPHVRARLLRGKAIPAAEYIRARERQRMHRAEIQSFLQDFTAVLTPTTAIPAATLEEVDEESTTMARLTRPVNYLGLCALALPCGFCSRGLPISLQIIAAPGHEETVLRVGRAYEAATNWQRRPRLDRFSAVGDKSR
ncbi:MAG TPA: amidase [Alphaproteobacteria bacterium]|nr:amidase [Alphaproteobacteria bacterium]